MIVPIARVPRGPMMAPDTRSRAKERDERVALAQRDRATYTTEHFWHVAAALPFNDLTRSTGGRPRAFPDYGYLAILGFTAIHGSRRAAVTMLRDPAEWDRFTRHIHHYVPEGWTSLLTGLPKSASRGDDARDRLRGQPLPPPTDDMITYWLDRYRDGNNDPRSPWYGVRSEIVHRFEESAVALAQANGLLSPDKPCRFAAPDRTRSINFDGTVLASRSVRLEGAGQWQTGEKRIVHGSKFVFGSTRGPDYLGRVILTVNHVDTKKNLTSRPSPVDSQPGEHAAVEAATARLLAHAAGGIRYLTVDSAVRGQSVTTLHRMGVIVVNYPHAASNPDGGAGQRLHPDRTEKQALVHVLRGEHCDHRIIYQGAIPHQLTLTDDGTDILARLTITEYDRITNKDGTYRHYHLLHVPCPDGPHQVRVALFHADGPSGSVDANRGEVVRVYPPDSDQFKHLYGVRNDTEAWHADLKSRFPKRLRRDLLGQELMLIAAAIAYNGSAHAAHQQRHSQPNAFDNTA